MNKNKTVNVKKQLMYQDLKLLNGIENCNTRRLGQLTAPSIQNIIACYWQESRVKIYRLHAMHNIW